MSEEAEESLMCHFLLTHRYTVLHPVWCHFPLQSVSVCCSGVLLRVRAVSHTWRPVHQHRVSPVFRAASGSGFL
ncbi:hypothetical protein CRN16_26750 (plasmid) [Escherichia coli]|nr:hypothetical protein CRN16_26750 [Escherichia coli]